MTLLLVTSLPKFLKKWCIDGSNCKWELSFWFQIKNCLNHIDDVTNVCDDVFCNEFWLLLWNSVWSNEISQTFMFISFKLGKNYIVNSVNLQSKTVLSVKLWCSSQADKI